MIKKLPYFLGLFLLFIGSKTEGRNAADVIFYHYRASLDDNKIDHFSLFPEEIEINNFPTPTSENETDLAILQKYYKNVALAYGNHLKKKIEPKLSEYKKKLSKQQQQMQIIQARSLTGKSQFSRSLREGRGKVKGENRPDQEARIKAISYYSTTFKKLSESAASFRKKAGFYEELSETTKELYRGEIH